MKATPATKSSGRERDEDEDDALEVRLDGRREERPGLPEEHGQRDRERGDQADLDRGGERLGDAERDELACRREAAPVSHSMICSWNANVTRKIGTIATSAMISRERSSSRCSTSVASSPWSRRRGSHRRSTRWGS